MTQEEKQLLLIDLSARLPYGVKCKHKFSDYKEVLNGIKYENAFCYFTDCEPCLIEDIKPYLLPLSSMTIEQRQELGAIVGKKIYREINYHECIRQMIDFYHKHHFDYRGLIEKGLAIDCTNLNIY